MELLKVMDQVAESHKKPVAQVAVNWSTQKDYVGTAWLVCEMSRRPERTVLLLTGS